MGRGSKKKGRKNPCIFWFVFCPLMTQHKGQKDKVICMQAKLKRKIGKIMDYRDTVLLHLLTVACPTEIDGIK